MIFSSEDVLVRTLKKMRFKLRGSQTFDISSTATLKEREQIEDMVLSTFNDLDHIDSEGVNHVVMESSMIDKL